MFCKHWLSSSTMLRYIIDKHLNLKGISYGYFYDITFSQYTSLLKNSIFNFHIQQITKLKPNSFLILSLI